MHESREGDQSTWSAGHESSTVVCETSAETKTEKWSIGKFWVKQRHLSDGQKPSADIAFFHQNDFVAEWLN